MGDMVDWKGVVIVGMIGCNSADRVMYILITHKAAYWIRILMGVFYFVGDTYVQWNDILLVGNGVYV